MSPLLTRCHHAFLIIIPSSRPIRLQQWGFRIDPSPDRRTRLQFDIEVTGNVEALGSHLIATIMFISITTTMPCMVNANSRVSRQAKLGDQSQTHLHISTMCFSQCNMCGWCPPPCRANPSTVHFAARNIPNRHKKKMFASSPHRLSRSTLTRICARAAPTGVLAGHSCIVALSSPPRKKRPPTTSRKTLCLVNLSAQVT